MKLSFVLIPIIFLVLLNACSNPNSLPTNLNDAQWTQIAVMQTARMLTPTYTPTPEPQVSNIVRGINTGLDNQDELEKSLQGDYRVGYAAILPANSLTTYMQVDVYCVRTYNNTQACNRFQAFIKVIQAMKSNKNIVIDQVPQTVVTLYVYLIDNGTQFTPVSAAWSDVKDYLNDKISGYEFGYRVSSANPGP